jgi:hypothetical protein
VVRERGREGSDDPRASEWSRGYCGRMPWDDADYEEPAKHIAKVRELGRTDSDQSGIGGRAEPDPPSYPGQSDLEVGPDSERNCVMSELAPSGMDRPEEKPDFWRDPDAQAAEEDFNGCRNSFAESCERSQIEIQQEIDRYPDFVQLAPRKRPGVTHDRVIDKRESTVPNLEEIAPLTPAQVELVEQAITLVKESAKAQRLFQESDGNYQIASQPWFLVEFRNSDQSATDLAQILQSVRFPDVKEQRHKRLQGAVAKTAADDLVAAIWKVGKSPSGPPLVQVVNLLDDTSNKMQEAVRVPLQDVAGAGHVPDLVSLPSVDVAVTLLTTPMTEPIADLAHGLEVAGIIIAVATGMHPLLIACAKPLLREMLSNAISEAFEKLIEELLVSTDARQANDAIEKLRAMRAADTSGPEQATRRLSARDDARGSAF